ncbi:ferredoxin [Alteribacillus iranensis]|uniref:Ferredoxin n=1 Tax=Alteribacillus iranensis TaxID=930128 RepID=A0A1I2E4J3_9BACI|nr:ferredoxin [Alteribacillus iranensis]SFE87458.1 ferredoxin [Alteribacillus iranensis]
MAKYTFVDKETCISCGSCEDIAPDIFEYDDEGLSQVIIDHNTGTEEVPEELEEDVIEAFECCPSESIKLQDTPFASKTSVGNE